MDSREARIVLGCYRPGVDDPRSEPFAAALEQVRRDPDLARWLERETAFDAAIGEKLRQSPVPADLETRILADRPAAAPVPLWRRPLVAVPSLALALAAAIVLVVVGRRASTADFPSWRGQMAALVAGDYKLDVEARDLPALQEFFARRHWPADYSVPAALLGYPLEGGMAVDWRGRRISVICFGVENDDDKDVWLFITEPDAIPGAPSSPVPAFAPAGKLMTAAWTSAGKLYLLAGRGDETSLRAFLPERVSLNASGERGSSRDPLLVAIQ